MKLSRQTTSDILLMAVHAHMPGAVSIISLSNMRPTAELVAIDELLEKAGWSNDGCPNYEKDDEFGNAGYSCGYWIQIGSAEASRLTTNVLRGRLVRISPQRRQRWISAYSLMSDKECKDVASVASSFAVTYVRSRIASFTA
ncbi:hypothetical protein ACLB1E_34255 [Escherichia coli]